MNFSARTGQLSGIGATSPTFGNRSTRIKGAFKESDSQGYRNFEFLEVRKAKIISCNLAGQVAVMSTGRSAVTLMGGKQFHATVTCQRFRSVM